MRAGKLKHKLIIQKRAATETRNSRGEQTTVWTTHATAMAALRPIGGREKYSAQRVDAGTVVKFETRYVDGLTNKMRLIHRQQPYYIGSAIDVDRRKRQMFIYAQVKAHGYEIPAINISNVAGEGGDPFYVVITYDTDQEGSTKVRYREEGGSWSYTDEADTDPRMFSHSETIGPLAGEKNYEVDVWTEDHFGQTDGYEGGLTFGIAADGSYLADGYVALTITEGPSVSSVGGTAATFIWTTSTAAYHRVRYRGQGLGDDDWITTEFSVEASMSASVYVDGIPCTHEIHEYQVQSCLVGDGSNATDWTPVSPNIVDMIRVADINLSNFNATKQSFPANTVLVTCESHDNGNAVKARIKTRWKKSGGSWTEAPTFSGASTIPSQILYLLTVKPNTAYIYESRKQDLCGNASDWMYQHGFSTTAGNEIYDQW